MKTSPERTTLRMPIALVCTDFDGTLYDGTPNADDLIAFREVLADLRRCHDARWAIVTGRPLPDLMPLLGLFMSYRLFPDFVVVADALIFKRNLLGRFGAFHFWNAKIALRRHTLFRWHSARLVAWRDDLQRRYPEAKDCSKQAVDVWLRFPDQEEAMRAEDDLLDSVRRARGKFMIFRWGNELFLAPAAGTKGEAVRRLGRHLGIPKTEVFAVGDGPNDLPMLQGGVVGMPACVGNAAERIKQVVGEGGGFIARGACLKGVLEALWFYAGVGTP